MSRLVMRGKSLFLAVILAALVAMVSGAEVRLKVVNHAGAPLQVFWVNTFSAEKELVPQTTKSLRNNSDTEINSYSTHQFTVRWTHHVPGTEVVFEVGSTDETQRVTADNEGRLHSERSDARTEALSTIRELSRECSSSGGWSSRQEVAACLAQLVTAELSRVHQSTLLVKDYHRRMLLTFDKYRCGDQITVNESVPTHSQNYLFLGRQYPVNVYLSPDNPDAQVWSIDDFLTADDCAQFFPTTAASTATITTTTSSTASASAPVQDSLLITKVKEWLGWTVSVDNTATATVVSSGEPEPSQREVSEYSLKSDDLREDKAWYVVFT
jgi:hypothetical protein